MKMVLASSNPGKYREFTTLLQPYDVELIPQSILKINDAEETGCTFIENALIKARHAAYFTDYPVLADDSGLCVPALKHRPGIHSARFAGSHANAQDNINKLLAELADVPEESRTAIFYCVLIFLTHAKDPIPTIAEGRWHGSISFTMHGQEGFGYDPIFLIPAYGKTAAELPTPIKNQISHRGQAMQSLLSRLFDDAKRTFS